MLLALQSRYTSSGLSPYADVVLADAPHAYWRLDEREKTVVDQQNNLNGTTYGAIGQGAASLLVSEDDPATEFNGRSRIDVIGTDGLTGHTAFTLEAWVKIPANDVESTGAGKTRTIYSEQNSNQNFISFYVSNVGRVMLDYSDGILSSTGSLNNPTTKDDTIHHLVVVVSGTSVTFYKDGVIESVDTLTSTNQVSAPAVIKLASWVSGDFKYRGVLDEVAIYRSALTAAQIQNHFKTGIGSFSGTYCGAVHTDNPYAYWRLNDRGKAIVDQMGRLNGTTYGEVIQGNSGLIIDDEDPAVLLRGFGWIETTGRGLVGQTAFTIEAWVRLDSTDVDSISSKSRTIYSEGGGTANNYIKFYVGGAGRMRLDYQDLVALSQPGTLNNATLKDDAIHHIVVVVSGTVVTFYRDGALESTDTLTSAAQTDTNSAVTLGEGVDTAIGFVGVLDEVAIYRTALTAAQIQSHYDVGAGHFFEDSEAITDATTVTVSYVRTINDGVGVTDANSRTVSFVRSVNDPEGITDARTVTASYLRTASDNEGITDTRTVTVAYSKPVNDSEGLTDAQVVAAAYSRTVSNSLGLTDAIALTMGMSISDAQGITDAMSRVVAYGRTVNDSSGTTDAFPATVAYNRSKSDSVGISDFTAITLALTVSDSLGMTDSITKAVAFAKTIADAQGLTDAMTVLASYARTVTDAAGITDAVALTRALVLSDSSGLSDSTTPALTMFRTMNDSEGLTDAITSALAAARTIADPVGITDAMALFRGLTVSDAVGLVDTASRVVSFLRTVLDAAGIVDAATSTATYRRTISDPEGLTDAVSFMLAAGGSFFTEFVDDTVGATDASNYRVAFVKNISDAQGLADTMAAVIQFVRTVNDPTTISDLISRTAQYSRALSDAAGLADAIVAAINRQETINDSVGVTDLMERIHDAARTINELVQVSDSVEKVSRIVREIFNQQGMTDRVRVTSGVARAAALLYYLMKRQN